MNIEVRRNSEGIIIEVAGRLDTTTAPTLEKTINENINDIKNLVLDFKELKYISSAGLRVLLSTQKKMQKNVIFSQKYIIWLKVLTKNKFYAKM